ncbi:MAG: hypothetical protein Unbinned2819contig1003_42 [Prokaryotic dsDNA virus sp.]|nr:MAG: hypothetical protein Unbinned2819contig1003_42 [Prokaryotic dsDNA virus sp.]|tara:strand:- start:21495 stop:22052 length:558 start_codon:yes stop_codon:yes gene_type:complete
MRFSAVIYKDSGEVVSTVQNATALSMEGKTYIEAVVDGEPEDYYVSGGELREKSERPSSAHFFNYDTAAWELNLDEAKAQAWDNLKLDRDAQEFGAFSYNAWMFDADADSQARINSAAQAAMIDDTFDAIWTLADNTTQALTATQLKELCKALSNHIKAAHDRGRIVRAQVEAATTIQELEAISW